MMATSAENQSATDTPVRIAVVGLGHGREHLDHYRGCRDVEVVGLCDTNEELLRKTGEQYGVSRTAQFTDYEKMLTIARPDAVFVMTPVPAHAAMTIRALESGCHVFVAKSLCRTLEEGEAMLRAREQSGKEVEVGFQCIMRKFTNTCRTTWPTPYSAICAAPGSTSTTRPTGANRAIGRTAWRPSEARCSIAAFTRSM